MTAHSHLWLALSPHGYGHAAMTAPLIAELRRRHPALRLTIQTGVPRHFLDTRYQSFELVPEIPDFGFRMVSALGIDLEASAKGYRDLHADWQSVVETEAERLTQARPDLVLANVPYAVLAGAAQAGIPAVGYSSLNWLDLYAHYLGDRPEAPGILAQMRAAHDSAALFLRPRPAQPMTLANMREIGPVARLGLRRGDEIRSQLGLAADVRLGVVAYGGIDHRLDLGQWPHLPGWFWLTSLADFPQRPDMAHWERAGVPFADLLPSADVVVTKPGYGTFTEAGLAGVAVLYEPRPDWPETAALAQWLANHTRSLPAEPRQMLSPELPLLLQTLFSQPKPRVAEPTGIAEGADILQSLMGL